MIGGDLLRNSAHEPPFLPSWEHRIDKPSDGASASHFTAPATQLLGCNELIRQRTLTQMPYFLYLLLRSKVASEEVKDDD